jgi:hypothetical protein
MAALWLRDSLCRLTSADGCAIFVTAAVCGGLLFLVAVCHRVVRQRELERRSSPDTQLEEIEAGRLPLPPGSLGLPFIGEMLQFVVEVWIYLVVIPLFLRSCSFSFVCFRIISLLKLLQNMENY